MLVLTAAVLALAAIGISQTDYYGNKDIPNYIKKALRLKQNYRMPPREKKRTFANLTLTEVLGKIKDITRAINQHAKKNGYFVDYLFRMY